MIIALLVLIMVGAIAAFVRVERQWNKSLWWMLEPHAGLKFITSWALLSIALCCIPMLIFAVTLIWS